MSFDGCRVSGDGCRSQIELELRHLVLPQPRVVPFDDRAQELAQKHSAGMTRDDYLIRSPRGRQLSSANLKRAVKWESLTDRRVHDLRRTAATQ